MTFSLDLLGKHCSILSGFAFKSMHFSEEAHGVPLIRIRDVKNGYSTTYYHGEYDKQYLIQNGDMLIGMDGEFNIQKWKGGEALLNQRVCKIDSTDLLNRGYLYYFMPKALKEIEDRTPFVTVKHLSVKQIKDIQIPLPPLKIQKQIAAVLDRADALIRARRRSIEKLDELIQSLFIDMFGDPVTNPMRWEINVLEAVASFSSGNSLPSGEEFTGQNDGYLLLKVSDLNKENNQKVIVESQEWSKEKQKGIQAEINSIIFPKRGGAIGTNKKRLLSRKALLDPNLMAVLGNKESINHLYLYQWFNTFNLSDITSGSSVPQLNKKDLAPLKLATPPLDLQNQFAERVQTIEAQKALYQQSLESLQNLFDSLMQRAFNGELEFNDEAFENLEESIAS